MYRVPKTEDGPKSTMLERLVITKTFSILSVFACGLYPRKKDKRRVVLKAGSEKLEKSLDIVHLIKSIRTLRTLSRLLLPT